MTKSEAAANDVVGWTDGYREGRVCGWAWRPGLPEEKVSIEVLLDGKVVAEAAACLERGDLRSSGIGQGWHAFAVPLVIDPSGPETVRVQVRTRGGAQLPGGDFELRSTPAGLSLLATKQPNGLIEAAFGLTPDGGFVPPRTAAPARKTPFTFILYCATGIAEQATQLGKPEYGYHFAMRRYRAVLRHFGTVHVVKDPAREVDPLYEACAARGEPCLFLSFAPPHHMAREVRCPTIPVVAWEYSTIPCDTWDGDPMQDWRYGLRHVGRAITLSTFAADSIRRAMGAQFPVVAIPAPVWDRFSKLRAGVSTRSVEGKATVKIEGFVLDTRNHRFFLGMSVPFPPSAPRKPTDEPVAPPVEEAPAPESVPVQEASPPPMEKTLLKRGLTRLRRFAGHSREAVRELLPDPVAHRVGRVLERARALRHRADPPAIEAPIVAADPPAPPPIVRWPVEELPPIPAPKLAESSPYPDDPPPPTPAEDRSSVVLDGVVFTAVLAPIDSRKNWTDLLIAFITAFRDTQDATLVLKMVGPDASLWWWTFYDILCRMPPFSCRVVVLHGYLDDARYGDLISASDWALNASLAEGMCLPLVEFMSGGKPAVAPSHTAMLDYVDETNAVLIRSEEELCAFPHDPRNHLQTTRHRVEWTSIRDALTEAYRISTSDKARYRSMSEAAAARIRDCCSDRVVAEKLAGFLGLDPGAVQVLNRTLGTAA